ncbi:MULTISPECIES: hypothetical protein [Helicobacter]|uniref:Uncharacterized protein n=1 Tax=Helicobacter bilis ATCC 43879 TaxID=613026 RepID=C3XFN3_9HELI|nr:MULTISPECIES: hypothetical protein [Helicobacter]EEO23822.1 hypothetical protein HRAG_00879 [Helicobacter bilis ATCC 43879]
MSNFREIKRMLRYLGIRSRKIKELKKEITYLKNIQTFDSEDKNNLRTKYIKQKEISDERNELYIELCKKSKEIIEKLDKDYKKIIKQDEKTINECLKYIEYMENMLNNRIDHDECIPTLIKEYNILVHNTKYKERAKSTYSSLKMSKWIINAERIIDETIEKMNKLNNEYNQINNSFETYHKQKIESTEPIEKMEIKPQLKTRKETKGENNE